MAGEKTKTKDKNEVGQVWNFKGRFADYMRDLTTGNQEDYKVIFDTIYHGYAFCALYGLLKGRRHTYDANIDNPNDSLQQGFRWTSADTTGIYSYEMLRKYVLLYSKASDEPFDTRIDRALRYDYPTNDVNNDSLAEKSQYSENSKLIDEYVLGGLELLYEKISTISSQEAMIAFMNTTIYEFN